MKRWWSFCLCLLLTSCGGGNSRYGDHPPVPVSGQVLVNGQPAKGAKVTFFHEGDWGPYSIVPQAWTGKDGHFNLMTYGAKDGAPIGSYQITVEWPAYRHGKDWGPDKLGNKYAKRETSGLTAKVEKGKNDLAPFDLKISPAQVKLNEAVDAKEAARKAKIAKLRADKP